MQHVHAVKIEEGHPCMWMLKHWLFCLLDRGKRFTIGSMASVDICLFEFGSRKDSILVFAGERLTRALSKLPTWAPLFEGLDLQQVGNV